MFYEEQYTVDIKDTKSQLLELTLYIIVSVYSQKPESETDTFNIREKKQTIIVQRCSKTEFHMISVPQLTLLHKFASGD